MDNNIPPQVPSVEGLIQKYGYWGVHQKYPEIDWKYLVAQDDTRQSYWGWVHSKLVEEHKSRES